LKTLEQNATVILSADGEGNQYNLLHSIDANVAYDASRQYDIEIGIGKLTDKYKSLGYTKDDVLEGGKNAVVLYPTG
jgi:hypothetical protein